MHKVLRLLTLEWSTVIQYRLDLILWMTVEAMTPLISLAVWYRVAESSSHFLTPRDTLTYYLLVMFVLIITHAWNGMFFAREILNGEIARFLTRPLGLMWHHVASSIVEKSIKLAIPLPVFIVCVLVFRNVFSSSIYELQHVLLFLLSLAMAAILSFVFDMCLGTIAFWMEDAEQIRGFKYMLQEIASGIIIPLVVLPSALFVVVSFLPFRYMISAPIEILMGQVEGAAAWRVLGYQAAWTVVLSIIFAVALRRGLKHYAVPGQ